MWISRNRVRAMENMHQKSRGEQRAHRVLVHIQVRRIKQEQEKIKHRLQAEVAMKPVFRGPSPSPLGLIPAAGSSAGAFIVSVVGPSYLITLLPLRLTMSSYLSTMPLVLVVRRASASKECRPYLRQVGCTTTDAPHTCIRQAARVGSATSTGNCPRAR
ncbi:hypothetical protein GW17_00017236 [Ensete ventricosum]|nr:hypothetical protein GW17_00017236 [Ensete ventricosum]